MGKGVVGQDQNVGACRLDPASRKGKRVDYNLVGRVQRIVLPPSQALYPIFEAVSNSIHAIRDGEAGPGRITVPSLPMRVRQSGRCSLL